MGVALFAEKKYIRRRERESGARRNRAKFKRRNVCASACVCRILHLCEERERLARMYMRRFHYLYLSKFVYFMPRHIIFHSRRTTSKTRRRNEAIKNAHLEPNSPRSLLMPVIPVHFYGSECVDWWWEFCSPSTWKKMNLRCTRQKDGRKQRPHWESWSLFTISSPLSKYFARTSFGST